MSLLQSTVIQNFKKYLDIKKIKQIEFCRATGYSRASLSMFMTGRTALPRLDFIEALVRFDPTLNIRWLLLNEGSMFLDDKVVVYQKVKVPQSESELVESMRKMMEVLMEEHKEAKEEIKRLKEGS